MFFTRMDLSSPTNVVMPDCFKGLKVLLVDHDTTSLMYLASALEEQSYKVTTTELASIALSMIGERESQYDIVIADIDMPEMDGFEFLKKILTKTHIPIILMSSSEDLGVAKRALDEGASFFFLKPIGIHNLVNVWQHVFRERLERKSQKVLFEKKVFLKEKSLDGKDGKAKGVDMQTLANANGLDPNFGKLVSSVLEISIEQSKEKGHINDVHGRDHLGKNGKEKLSAANSIADQHKESSKRKREDNAKGKRDGKRATKSVGLVKRRSSNGIKLNEENEREQKDENGISSEKKSSRLTWTPQLHLKFMEAVAALGEDRAQPIAILNLMGTPHLTPRHIGSHLQKYRAGIKRARSKESKSNDGDLDKPWEPINIYDCIFQSPQTSKAFNVPAAAYKPSRTTYAPPSPHVKQPQLNIGSSSYYNLETLEKLLQNSNLSTSATRKKNTPSSFGHDVQGYSACWKTIEEAEKFLGLEGCSTGASQLFPANEAASSIANVHQQSYPSAKPMVSQVQVQNQNDFSSACNSSGLEADFDMGQLSSSEDIHNLLQGFYDAGLDLDAITGQNAPPCTLPQQQPASYNTSKALGGDEVSDRSSGYPKGDEIDSFLEWLELPPNSDDEFHPYIGS